MTVKLVLSATGVEVADGTDVAGGADTVTVVVQPVRMSASTATPHARPRRFTTRILARRPQLALLAPVTIRNVASRAV